MEDRSLAVAAQKHSVRRHARLSNPAPAPNSTIEKNEMKLRIMKRNSQFRSSLAGVCSVLLLLGAGQSGIAQQSTAAAAQAAKPPAAQEEEKESAAPSRQGGDGIKVHGHWKFVVHDPDGKLVSSREFDNALLTPALGDFVLSTLLLGQSVAVEWGIVLCPQAGGTWNNGTVAPNYYSYCTAAGPTPIAFLVPNLNGAFGSHVKGTQSCGGGCVPGLQAQLTGSINYGTQAGILLSGSYTAPQNVTIYGVETVTAVCNNTLNTTPGPLLALSPQACDALIYPISSAGQGTLFFSVFTGTFLGTAQTPPSQNLTVGQVLTVTVTLSFS
jgi:hypothetical protein